MGIRKDVILSEGGVPSAPQSAPWGAEAKDLLFFWLLASGFCLLPSEFGILNSEFRRRWRN